MESVAKLIWCLWAYLHETGRLKVHHDVFRNNHHMSVFAPHLVEAIARIAWVVGTWTEPFEGYAWHRLVSLVFPKGGMLQDGCRSWLAKDSFSNTAIFGKNTHAIWCFEVPYMLSYINALVFKIIWHSMFHIKGLTWRKSKSANIIRLVSSLAHQMRRRPSQVSEEWPVVLRGDASIAVWLWMSGSTVCLLFACHRCATIHLMRSIWCILSGALQ